MKQDYLNRTEFVDRIVNFVNTLSDMNKGACFAIDGKWGSGKSFVLDMIESKLCEIQSEETADNKFLLAHYNCWQYDYYEEPAVAMVAALLDCIENEETVFNNDIDSKIKAAWSLFKDDIKKMAGKFSENHIGINVIEVFENFQNAETAVKEKNTDYDSMFAFRETLETARKTLAKIAEDKTIVFVVDELDRCMPPYAIKVLERLHHFFDGIDNVIVMIAVDSVQLNHSVKQIYGRDADEKAYLRKFIGLTFCLDTGKIQGDIFEKYASFLSKFSFVNTVERDQFEEVFNNIWLGEDMRTQEKAMEKAKIIHSFIASGIMDGSMALYEVMSVRFKGKFGESLNWISKMNHTTFVGIEDYIKKDTVEYLKELKQSAETGEKTRVFSSSPYYHYFHNNILGKSFFYIDQCYPGDIKFILDKENEIDKEHVSKAKKFAQLLSMID